jgi:hypothetical protein
MTRLHRAGSRWYNRVSSWFSALWKAQAASHQRLFDSAWRRLSKGLLIREAWMGRGYGGMAASFGFQKQQRPAAAGGAA